MRVVHARVCVALLVSYSIDNRQLLRTMTSGHRLDVAAISSAVAGAVTQALRMQQQGEPGSNKCSFLRMSHQEQLYRLCNNYHNMIMIVFIGRVFLCML